MCQSLPDPRYRRPRDRTRLLLAARGAPGLGRPPRWSIEAELVTTLMHGVQGLQPRVLTSIPVGSHGSPGPGTAGGASPGQPPRLVREVPRAVGVGAFAGIFTQ